MARETDWKAQSEFLQARQQRKHGPAAHTISKIQDQAIQALFPSRAHHLLTGGPRRALCVAIEVKKKNSFS
jgi:hypothetical protein